MTAARLATWRELIGAGRMLDGEPFLAGTARPLVARLSKGTAAQAGLGDGDKVTVATRRGSVTLPVEITPMADGVVWVPAGAGVSGYGDMVTLRTRGDDPPEPPGAPGGAAERRPE